MKSGIIYVGTIYQCTLYQSKVMFQVNWNDQKMDVAKLDKKIEKYKENAILLKTKNDKYVDIDSLHFSFDYLRFLCFMQNVGTVDQTIMSTGPYFRGNLFVVESLLVNLENSELPIEQPYSFQKVKALSETLHRK